MGSIAAAPCPKLAGQDNPDFDAQGRLLGVELLSLDRLTRRCRRPTIRWGAGEPPEDGRYD
jgi:hypothetical protein